MAMVSSAMSGTAAVRDVAGTDASAFPFRCELSLAPLITFWTQLSAYHEFGRGPIPGLVREKAREAPELAGVIDDLSVIGKHQTFVDPMMAAERLWLAYELILERVYGVELGGDVPVLMFTTTDSVTGLDQHFRLQFDWRFVDVQVVGPKPPLPDGVRQELAAGRLDSEKLRQLLPAERFVLRSFMIVKAVDVTDQEVLSSLKRDLIDKDSIVSSSHFQGLQAKLRTFFRRPDLGLGLAAVEGDRVLVLNDASRHEQACIFADSAHHTTSEFTGSLYERAVVQDRPLVIEDLLACPERRDRDHRLLASRSREPVGSSRHVRPRRPRPDRGVSERARRPARHGLQPAPAVRGERHRHRGKHLVVPGPRGTRGAGMF